MFENPGAYNESRNRLREEKEREKKALENITERFEKEKNLMRTEKKFDMFELRHRIETGRSLLTLQNEINNALKEGIISREAFDTLQEKIVLAEKIEKIVDKDEQENFFKNEDLPFGKTELAKFFDNKKIWENILVDFAGFFYGFLIQGSAILVILLWKIFLDIIFLPRDIYNEIKK